MLLATEVQPVDTLLLGALDRILIEIGGPQAGNPDGGNNLDGYDQINVANTATLGGTLQIALVNGYIPEVGESFEFLTFAGNWSGTFATAEGLFSFPAGDRFFDVVPTANSLRLVVTAVPGLDIAFQPLSDLRDDFGEFLSSYFTAPQQFTYSGSLSVADFAHLSATVAMQKEGSLLKLGASQVTALAGCGFGTASAIGVLLPVVLTREVAGGPSGLYIRRH